MKQPLYGYPCVANPHDFDPDHECCSPAEIETHRLAKENWGKPAFVPNRGCGALVQDGRVVGRVTRTSWGIGVNLINHCDECNTPDDDLMYCHDCARDLCPRCWPEHERKHDFAFRLNEGNCGRRTLDRLDSFVDGMAGKRLTYAGLIAEPEGN